MKEFFFGFLLVLLVLFFVMLLGVGMGWWSLWFQRVAMPYQEQTRRLTYQQSATHQEGSNTNFQDLCLQWSRAPDSLTRDMIAVVIRQRRSVYMGPPLSDDVMACFARVGI